MSVWKQLVILILLTGLGFWGWQSYLRDGAPVAGEAPGGARAVTMEVAEAALRRLARTVEAVGTTRALQSVQIVPLASGRVLEVAIRPGQRVEAGDVLVRLDDDIERANLAEAQAQLVEQSQAVERAQRLRSTNSIAVASLEQVQAAQAAAEAAVARAARRLEDREIRAPFAGVVGLTEVDIGARVDDETVLTTLDDLSQIEIEFGLPETLYAEIGPGLPVMARSAAFPGREFRGAVAAVDSRIDPVSRSFRVRAVLPNPDGLLPSGMFMFLVLTLSQAEAVVVPEAALIVQAAQTYVYVIEGEKARRRTVETGQREAGVVAVRAGLAAGETVAVRGTQRLRDGAAVRVLAPDPPPQAAAGGAS